MESNMKKQPGWQQAATPPPNRPTCLHIGLLGAALSMHRHAVGHAWVCPCGDTFVVARDDEGNKRMRAVR